MALIHLRKSKTTDRYKRSNGTKRLRLGLCKILENIYVDQEKTARENKRGLWQSSDPTPPWAWRKR